MPKDKLETEEPDNLTRLLGHLKKGTLAARLVAARIAAKNGDPGKALQAVLHDRLEELKGQHDPDNKT